MTTTAERTPRAVPSRDADVPPERLRVLPRPREGTTALPSAARLAASRRDSDEMNVSFAIAARGEGQAVPPQDARRVGAMRRLVKARLTFCGLTHMTDTVSLVVSELVTNAIVHGRGTTVVFSMELKAGYLRVAVRNDVPVQPTVQYASDDAEHGRGLQLVEWCTAASGGNWGVSDGAEVWCEFPVKGEDQ